MIKNNLLLVLIIHVSSLLSAQNEQFAREILAKLCSPELHGRGYTFGGDSMAAYYIQGLFEGMSLKQFNGSFFQPFVLTANTFDNRAYIISGKDTLRAGNDFVVKPSSKSAVCHRKILFFNPFKKSSVKKLQHCIQTNDSNFTIVFDTVGVGKALIDRYYTKIERFNREVSHVEIMCVDKLPPQGIAVFQSGYSTFYVLKKLLKNNTLQLLFDATLKYDYTTRNIVAYIPGETDTFKVITAHYDHVGTLGRDAYFPGAHDNASGTAMLIDLASYFSKASKPHYSLAFMFFSGEEAGLLGSNYYTRNPMFPLSKIKTLINLDMLGSGDEGIMVVNGSVLKDEFDFLVNINNTNNYVPNIRSRGEAANSDHYFFYKKGVKSLYIYTLGTYKEYHNIYDRAEAIPMPVYNGIFNLVKDFVTDY